jgi:hypothetical protein
MNEIIDPYQGPPRASSGRRDRGKQQHTAAVQAGLFLLAFLAVIGLIYWMFTGRRQTK